MKSFTNYLKLVKFSHTIFAMPFAFTGFFLSYSHNGGELSYAIFLKIVLCMVFARNAAMGFNRYIDRYIDAANPRTASREIPSGVISSRSALLFVIFNTVMFSISALWINPLCFYLSFPALGVLLGYSYMKRFTALCHYVLGLALAIAPAGAYIAFAGRADLSIIVLSLIVLFWSANFDIIYSLADEEYDRENGLKSIPATFGRVGALILSAIGHLIVIPLLVLFGLLIDAGALYIIGASIFTVLLVYQHAIIKKDDISRVNAAFFTANGYASVLFAIFSIADILF